MPGVIDDVKTLIKDGDRQPTEVPAAPKKVLIVEDEKNIAEPFAEVLKSRGFNVITAENGQTGLEAAISQKPDLILLDLMMPIMDGKTMLHRLRQIPEFKTLPVIILTNAGDVDNIMYTKTFDNADEFLIKSNIDMEELVKKVKTYVGI